ncbi:MAG: amidohydrolase family protein [Kiritimatiellae bacterium]|nr:amidohydrolase family protein [Kiritimatiellia bacterium]
MLAKIGGAVDSGLLLGSDRYPYCAAGTDLDIVLPDWAQEGAAPAEMKRLADPALRARIAAEIDASDRDWSTVMIGGTWHEETKPLSGRTVAELLSGRTSPGELVCRVLELDGCKTGAFFFGMCEGNLDRILSMPWIVPGSDASLRAPWGPLGADHPHPRAYGTMPEFYRRVRALGFTREQAIARMTSVPADRFGIAGRGRIAAGSFADIVVFDEAAFASAASYADPHRFASGVKCVMVNGIITHADGEPTGRRGGRFLERR